MNELLISMHEWKSLELTHVEENTIGPIATNPTTISRYNMIKPVSLTLAFSFGFAIREFRLRIAFLILVIFIISLLTVVRVGADPP